MITCSIYNNKPSSWITKAFSDLPNTYPYFAKTYGYKITSDKLGLAFGKPAHAVTTYWDGYGWAHYNDLFIRYLDKTNCFEECRIEDQTENEYESGVYKNKDRVEKQDAQNTIILNIYNSFKLLT